MPETLFIVLFSNMEGVHITFWLTLVSFACWPICFWWMHRISKEQREVLTRLRQQGERIERLSKAEHDLVKELHPKVGQIQEDVEQIAEATVNGPSALPIRP